jgi:predicted transcriptional regulator
MKIQEIMSKKLLTVEPTDTLKKAWDLMFKEHVRHLVVLEEEKVVGIISDRDLLKSYQRATVQSVSDIMSWPVMTVQVNTQVEDVVEEVMLQKVSAFIVDDEKGKTVGIVTTEDLLTYLYMLIRSEKHLAKKNGGGFNPNELY